MMNIIVNVTGITTGAYSGANMEMRAAKSGVDMKIQMNVLYNISGFSLTQQMHMKNEVGFEQYTCSSNNKPR